MRCPAGSARLARKQAPGDREPPARGGGYHFAAHLLLVGFWRQNFNVLTGSIEKGWPPFLVLGVGLSLACVGVTVVVLSRRSWN
jgi:hypothetical protein